MSGLRIGPQLMDSLSAGRSPSRSKEEEEEEASEMWLVKVELGRTEMSTIRVVFVF